jgi:hypothetical protein
LHTEGPLFKNQPFVSTLQYLLKEKKSKNVSQTLTTMKDFLGSLSACAVEEVCCLFKRMMQQLGYDYSYVWSKDSSFKHLVQNGQDGGGT